MRLELSESDQITGIHVVLKPAAVPGHGIPVKNTYVDRCSLQGAPP
jgi:hypothetical protein